MVKIFVVCGALGLLSWLKSKNHKRSISNLMGNYHSVGNWQGLSIGYESNNYRLNIVKRVEWMVCHSDHKYLHHLQSSVSEWLMKIAATIFTQKMWMYYFDKFISIWSWVCRQYCTVPTLLCCIILQCNTVGVL